MRLLGLPPKLRLAPFWPALAAMVTASVFLWVLLPGLFERTASVQLFNTLRILRPLVQRQLAEPGTDSSFWVHELAAGSGFRVTLIRGRRPGAGRQRHRSGPDRDRGEPPRTGPR